MSLTLLAGPVGLFSAGIAMLLGFIWYRVRNRASGANKAISAGCDNSEIERLEALLSRLESEKASVEAALIEAGETTRRLERVIGSFEATFSPASTLPDSVPAIFSDLRSGLDCVTSEWREKSAKKRPEPAETKPTVRRRERVRCS